MVFVSGEAGIGKTALVRRFCEELSAPTVIHRGFCDALGTPRALGPLHDIARTSLRGLGPQLTIGDGGMDELYVGARLLDPHNTEVGLVESNRIVQNL